MINSIKTKVTYITKRLIVVENIKKNNISEFYLAIKENFFEDKYLEFTPICKADTLEECLKEGLIEFSTKFGNLERELEVFFKSISHNNSDYLDKGSSFQICDINEKCRFDSFIVEDNKAYFCNDWDAIEEHNKKLLNE